MISMGSSTKKQLLLPNLYTGATAAPPPTPSTQSNHLSTSDSSAAADVLSKLLHRLPPTLSFPTRRSPRPPPQPTICPPIISLSNLQNPSLLDNILSSASQLGYFQLTDHLVPPQLALSAESDSLSLLNLTRDQKQKHLSFPKNWPLGFDGGDDEDGDGTGESFCFDASCFAESTQLNVSSLREFTREMEKVGLEVIESLCSSVGVENPFRKDPTRCCSLLWISEGFPGDKPVMLSRVYPYVIGLHYQIRSQKYSLLADSGWVSVSPEVDSVLVTIGDIAQVWSNGKLKKVRGKPVANLGGEDNKSRCITMSLLVTLPIDSIVSSMLPRAVVGGDDDDEAANNDENQRDTNLNFKPFAFEDYALRVYNQRVFFKDPLDRYRL